MEQLQKIHDDSEYSSRLINILDFVEEIKEILIQKDLI